MNFTGTHWLTLFVGIGIGYLIVPFLMSFFTRRAGG